MSENISSVSEEKRGSFYLGSGIKPTKAGSNLCLYRRDSEGVLHPVMLVDANSGAIDFKGKDGRSFLEINSDRTMLVNGFDLVKENKQLKTLLKESNKKIEGSVAPLVREHKDNVARLDRELKGLSKQLGKYNTQLVAVSKMKGPQGNRGPVGPDGITPKDLEYLKHSVEHFWAFHKKITDQWAAAEKAEAERQREEARRRREARDSPWDDDFFDRH